ncbi:hypothetical protein E2562_016573 [Oryza meyeriana var. granulata]|uniref:Acetyltransferase n=1 Tax=Oryza meyeriana var. granulata TaxID=110450 RepID=A0A6G1C8C0_9ORYZ|nr:hypothetical protein E2562_016573 [Oryza meyeriana var. granulata]
MGSNDDQNVALAVDGVRHIHLTPWDLRLISIDYIQKGILLPKPPVAGERLADALASSFARALALYYPFAGRLVAVERGDGTVTVTLQCTGEGAEFVHAAAPDVAVSDIVSSLYTPSEVWSFYSFNLVLGADAATESRPLLSVQVTELADGIFVAMSLNHAVADGTTFWHFFNTWSEMSRGGGDISVPSPALERWFLDSCLVPIPLPFGKPEDMTRRRVEYPPVRECFLHFPAESIRKLKARANDEMAGEATATISSLQSLLAHLWRAVCRARRLPPEQETRYMLLVSCRGRVKGIPHGYTGNAVACVAARSTAGGVLDKGMGWTAWLMNRAVASFDEATARSMVASWPRRPSFMHNADLLHDPGAMGTGSSPRFDVYGNDFGWGRPRAVRSGAGSKIDGKLTVYEGRGGGGGGSMALEVCLAPDALERLVADEEFMEAVSADEA